MPVQRWLDMHHKVRRTERRPLLLLKDGCSDSEIAKLLRLDVRAVRSRLHRFYERTEIFGPAEDRAEGRVSRPRRPVAWSNRHESCCIRAKSG